MYKLKINATSDVADYDATFSDAHIWWQRYCDMTADDDHITYLLNRYGGENTLGEPTNMTDLAINYIDN